MEMADEKWKIAGDLCRCCLAVGSHNKLGIAKFNDKASGDNEDFANMLLENLGLTLLPVKCVLSEITYTICNPCVERLRDAVSFRKQVQLSEEKFWNMYGRNMLIAIEPIVVKVEDVAPEDAYKGASDDDFNMDDFSDDDTKLNFIEIKAETKKSKGKAKAGIKGTATKKPPTRKMAARKTKTKSMMDAESVKAQKQKVKTEKTEAIKTEEEEEGSPAEETKPPVKRKKGSRAPKFRLQEDDYAFEGNEYVCKRCEKRYDKMCSLKFHVKTKHYKIPRFSCPICLKEFMTPAPLTVHKLEAHDIDERHHCNACRGAFNTKVQLRKHINNFHMLGERYKCEFCEYESFSFEGMYKHKFKHKTVKDYHCRFCRKSFLRKTTLDLHERIHTGDRRKVCTVCGQAFVQKASLNYHMAKYHPEVNF